MACLHSHILVYNDDKISRKAVMTTKFLKNSWQVPRQLSKGTIFSLKHKVTETDICQFYVVLLSWNDACVKRIKSPKSDFGLCLLTSHLILAGARWDSPGHNESNCGQLCGITEHSWYSHVITKECKYTREQFLFDFYCFQIYNGYLWKISPLKGTFW